MTLYEELLAKGLSARRISLELAYTIPYDYLTEKLIGLEMSTFKVIKFNWN